MSESDRRQIKWLVKNYHGVEYYIGGELTSNIKSLIDNFIKTCGIDIIYVKGHVKKDFLDKFLYWSIGCCKLRI